MAKKNWKGYTWSKAHGYTFEQIWILLEHGNTLDTRVEFPNELLIGLFWEESMFQNWWQKGNNGEDLTQHAVGFGQVERGTLHIMNALYPEKRTKYTSELIISDPQISVNATVDCLRYLRKRFPSTDRLGILHKYGGLDAGGVTDVRQKASQWVNCEGILLGARGEFSGDVITKALTAAEPNHAMHIPNVIGAGFSSNWGF
jgi:hypothetical protein